MCAKCIDITARETGGGSAVVSLRQNELICNLRALVAVRFEQAISMIVLIFGGQVLPDVGTIDRKGITEGVTVHVLFRQLRQRHEDAARSRSSFDSNLATKLTQSQSRLKNVEFFKPLLDDPATLRDVLYSDARIRALLDENTSFRHYMSSDRNLREVFSTIFNPAKVQELGRTRDIHILRLECMPGSYSLLGKMNCFLRQAHEDSVAATYQEIDAGHHAADNPQRGRENCLPLPNPWRRTELAELQLGGDGFSRRAECLVSDLKQKCDHLMQCLKQDDHCKTVQQARALNILADNARREVETRVATSAAALHPPQPSRFNRSLFDFMSANDSRWEQHFRWELLELDALGHTNQQRNITALLISFGDVKLACKLLKKWSR